MAEALGQADAMAASHIESVVRQTLEGLRKDQQALGIRRLVPADAERAIDRKDLPSHPADAIDLAHRVDLARRWIARLSPDGGALKSAVWSAFGYPEKQPDLVMAYAIDSLPGPIRADLARRAGVDIDQLLRHYWKRRNPKRAELVDAWHSVAGQHSFNAHRVSEKLASIFGAKLPHGGDVAQAASPLKALNR